MELLEAMQQEGCYPHATQNIRVVTTAISQVFLTGRFAYKVSKPVNFGFLDFSTLEKRKHFSHEEMRHNSLVSPELYENIVPITKEHDGRIQINGSGDVIEYAIKMKQMDPDATLSTFLQHGKVRAQHIERTAEAIYAFHKRAPTDPDIARYGNVATIQENWDENFEQTANIKGDLLSTQNFESIQGKVNTFITQNQRAFEQRVTGNQIKHCHGDFHSANVFIVADKPIIFDAIVFNKRFPCCDVIADVAFMAMDLDYHGKPNLSHHFIETYEQLSADADLPKLLNFYKCYRAYIRAKIACFTLADATLTPEQRRHEQQLARNYFTLAHAYSLLL